jgi:hypothetical protein
LSGKGQFYRERKNHLDEATHVPSTLLLASCRRAARAASCLASAEIPLLNGHFLAPIKGQGARPMAEPRVRDPPGTMHDAGTMYDAHSNSSGTQATHMMIHAAPRCGMQTVKDPTVYRAAMIRGAFRHYFFSPIFTGLRTDLSSIPPGVWEESGFVERRRGPAKQDG